MRSPVDVLRLLTGALVLVGGLVTVNLTDSALLGLSDDGISALAEFPWWLRDVPATIMSVAVIAAAASAAAWALVTRRFRRLLLLIASFVAAAGLSILFGGLISRIVDGPVQAAFDTDASIFRYRDGDGLVHPGDPLLAGAVAMFVVGSSYLRHATNRRIALMLAVYAIVTLGAAGVPAVGLPADIGSGILVGSLLLLVAGRHDLAPGEREVVASLASVGVEAQSANRLDVDARGSSPWAADEVGGEPVFAKVLGRDERSADLMFRAYRWVRLRRTGDHRPFVSLRRAVEHEALVALQAASLGIPTPRVLGVAEAGVDGMMIAYERLPGRSADTYDDLDDDVLASIWKMVNALHRTRIAHRDLRLANIFIGDDGQARLIDFGFAELAASDQLLGTDVAELLASTAAMVGPERAVAAAHRATGLAELARAMPWLQPLALSSATREAIDGDKGLAPIRALLIESCGVPEEDPVRLRRVEAKTLFLIATIALAVYILYPQLADIDDIWAQIRGGSFQWALVAIALSAVTYVASTASLLGAIPCRLPFGPSIVAQLASSFANRVTPAKVGGPAINLRYFQCQGVPTTVGATAIGLNAIAGLVVHVGLTITFLILASGRDTSEGLELPSVALLGFAGMAIVGLTATTMAVPFTRRIIMVNIAPHLRAGWDAVRVIGRSPSRLTVLAVGSAVITLGYLGAMVASLQAFGADASFPVIALLFLTGSAVANAAPTPGGIGAAEAALIAAFSTVESAEVVVPAVFLYRFVTFWLPIVPGWLALSWLRSNEHI